MRRVWSRPSLIATAVFAAALSSVAQADVKLPKVIASHMVLQQKLPIPIWGTADAGEEVTVSIGANSAQTKAGADGKWMVKLKELPAGGPHEVVIKGKNEIKLTDVLVGEVWVASGQSSGQQLDKLIHDLAADPRVRFAGPALTDVQQ